MKKIRVVFMLCIITCSLSAQDLRWAGDNNLLSTISRNGNIIVSGLYFGRYGSAIAGDPNPYQILSADNESHDLLFYGSAAATLHLRLYDGDLKFGQNTTPNAILYNSGRLWLNASDNSNWASFIQNAGGSGKGLLVRSASGDATPTFQVEDNLGNIRFRVNSDGNSQLGGDLSFNLTGRKIQFYQDANHRAHITLYDGSNGNINIENYWNEGDANIFIRPDRNVHIRHGDNSTAGIFVLQSGSGSYEVTNNKILFTGTQTGTTENPYGLRKDIQWLVGQEAGQHFTFKHGPAETEFLRISSTGYVGVGTSAPDHLLQVHSSSLPTIAIGKLNANTNGKSRIQFYAGDGNSSNGFSIDYNRASTVDRLGFIDGGSVERMTILNGGNVGIGTTNPDAKLAVKGTVHAEEVKVDLQVPGPDYVFEPSYQLPSLTEIEDYIKANKHLPEVPSAKEMETNGINLSEMNMLLLKKVEELTLYQIEANRKIELLQNQVEELLKNQNKK